MNIEVDGEIFTAHKLVLATRSPVFKAQHFGPMKDRDTQCVKIEEMEASVFKVSKHLCFRLQVILAFVLY